MRVADRFKQLPSVIKALPNHEFQEMLTYIDKEPQGARADAYYIARQLQLTYQLNAKDQNKIPSLEDIIPWTNHEMPPELMTESERGDVEDKENFEFMKHIEALQKQQT
ncbi:putative uncharacterized phage protein [Moritella viscosa]|nr:hypothetical protein [Moritella viscosa]CED59852.1 putative uncharacterized phage protein [Moritella viscosa]SHO03561.1 Aminoglycoside phosphotransferase [Moritella viscosa]